jgi:hypothetical protein
MVQNPQKAISPEQTSNLLTFLLFNFMNPTISEASKVTHLSANQLPPLCDYDSVRYLIKNSYKVCDQEFFYFNPFKHVPVQYLDPFSGGDTKSHLFWGLCKVLRRSIAVQIISTIVLVCLLLAFHA